LTILLHFCGCKGNLKLHVQESENGFLYSVLIGQINFNNTEEEPHEIEFTTTTTTIKNIPEKLLKKKTIGDCIPNNVWKVLNEKTESNNLETNNSQSSTGFHNTWDNRWEKDEWGKNYWEKDEWKKDEWREDEYWKENDTARSSKDLEENNSQTTLTLIEDLDLTGLQNLMTFEEFINYMKQIMPCKTSDNSLYEKLYDEYVKDKKTTFNEKCKSLDDLTLNNNLQVTEESNQIIKIANEKTKEIMDEAYKIVKQINDKNKLNNDKLKQDLDTIRNQMYLKLNITDSSLNKKSDIEEKTDCPNKKKSNSKKKK